MSRLDWYVHQGITAKDRQLLTSTPLPKWDEMGYVTSIPWINMGVRIEDNPDGTFSFVPFREKVYPDGRVENCL